MLKLLREVIAFVIAITLHQTASSQSLSVNTDGSTADPSALLDVKSTAKGVLVPRMSKADKNAIATPATGLLIFQNTPDSIGFHYYDGTKWAWIQNSAAADTINWKTAGNTGLADASSFLGNIDNVPLNFRINNQHVGKFNLSRWNYSIGRGAGNDLVSFGHVSIGDSAGAAINNGFAGVYIGYRSGAKNTGINNTFVGSWSGENTTTGGSNAFFGTSSGIRNTTGYSNAFLGHFSGYYNTTGAGNTAVGTQALQNDTTGIANVAVGYQSMYLNRAGSYNTAVGIYSLFSHRRPFASYNTAIGTHSLEQDTTGYYNVGVGTSSLRFNSNSIGNTAIGTNAMYNHKINDYNTAVGFESMVSDTAGNMNTAMGWRSLRYNLAGGHNTALGVGALEFTDSAFGNTAVGRGAMIGSFGNTTNLGYNTVMGWYAGALMDSVELSTAVGFQSGYNNRGRENTFLGTNSGGGFSGSNLTGIENTGLGTATLTYTSTGRSNTAVGLGALYANRTGSNNTAVGVRSMVNAQTASNNVAVGDSTLVYNTSGDLTAVGHFAMRNNTSGINNVAVGANALEQNTGGSQNTAVGSSALAASTFSQFNTAIGANNQLYLTNATGNTSVGSNTLPQVTTGGFNTAMGVNALYSDTTGSTNVAIGHWALFENRDGSYNTAIGPSKALKENRSGNFNIGIGRTALNFSVDGDFNIAIGDSALANTIAVGTAGNLAIGRDAGNTNTTGTFNTLIGYGADVSGTGFTNANALGYLAQAGQSNSLVLGSINGVNGAAATVSVGIGTNTPADRLHVRRNGVSGGSVHGSASVIIEDNSSSYLQFTNPTASETGLLSGNALTTIRSAIIFRADSSLQIRSGGNTTRMTIDNTGFVGIGTTAPATKLHIYEPTTTNVNLRVASFSTSYEPGIELIKTGAGTDWKIRAGAASGTLIFARSSDDFVTPIDEYEMSSTSFRPFTDGTNSLGLVSNRWTTVYATVGAINTSDARDKENITNLNYGLNEIMKLRPVSYTWRENPQWGKKIGFLAQEVQPVLKEVVQVGDLKTKNPQKDDNGNDLQTKNDKLGIYYSDIIPVTVKAIQEQQQQIEELKKKNEALQKDIELLKKLAGLKN